MTKKNKRAITYKTGVITRRYMKGKSVRQFARELTEGIVGVTVSHQSIQNWAHSATCPDRFLMTAIVMTAQDWRYDFAMEMLQVVAPEFYNGLAKEYDDKEDISNTQERENRGQSRNMPT